MRLVSPEDVRTKENRVFQKTEKMLKNTDMVLFYFAFLGV